MQTIRNNCRLFRDYGFAPTYSHAHNGAAMLGIVPLEKVHFQQSKQIRRVTKCNTMPAAEPGAHCISGVIADFARSPEMTQAMREWPWNAMDVYNGSHKHFETDYIYFI